MLKRKELKNSAKKTVSCHYFKNVLFVFLCSLLLTGGFNYTTKNIQPLEFHDQKINNLLRNKSLTSSEIFDELLEKTNTKPKLEQKITSKYTKGVISYLINQMLSSHSLIFTLLNTMNKALFDNRINRTITIIFSNFFITMVGIFFFNAIEVGKCRYFLEKRRYPETKIDRLFFPYQSKKTLHISYILFLKSLYQFLWNFTIIGGIIKYYQYKMIPYLLAENPNLSKEEVFDLSKQLTTSKIKNLFFLDLSMLGWDFLKIITLNLSGIFYSNIYKESLSAEVYMSLREEYLTSHQKNKSLNDAFLAINKENLPTYPEEKGNTTLKNKIFQLDYNKNYSPKTYLLFFMTFSMIGYFWEVFLHLVSDGTFINRGTMHGPWLPIYGFGGILILILLKKYRHQPFQLFIATFLLCGIIEYTTAWFLETFQHLKYWDYTGYFFNIKGRICLEGLLVFGLGGCGFTYLIAPLFDNIYQKINPHLTNLICVVFLLCFSGDLIYSTISPNTGEGISQEVIILKEKY